MRCEFAARLVDKDANDTPGRPLCRAASSFRIEVLHSFVRRSMWGKWTSRAEFLSSYSEERSSVSRQSAAHPEEYCARSLKGRRVRRRGVKGGSRTRSSGPAKQKGRGYVRKRVLAVVDWDGSNMDTTYCNGYTTWTSLLPSYPPCPHPPSTPGALVI